MTSKLESDIRLDPRIKKCFAGMPVGAEKPNVSSREELLAQENSPAALAALFVIHGRSVSSWRGVPSAGAAAERRRAAGQRRARLASGPARG